MSILGEINTEEMLSYTQGLLNHVYWVKEDFSVSPDKEHIATSINYSDISERKSDFLKELVNTITSWVYGKEKTGAMIADRLDECGGDIGNAATFLASHAFSKFRPGHPQGQFGELLLFNFLQHFFDAIPLLRKQRIVTSIGHERFGSDAVHYKRDGDVNVIILGESKCYKSDYGFKKAFETSIKSIEDSFLSFNDELDLYVYDDFIEPGVETIAKKYKEGALDNVKFELVCLIAYNEVDTDLGSNEAEIKNNIISIVKSRCKKLDVEIFNKVDVNVLNRINYIFFPIWGLDDLLNKFQLKVGSGS